MLSNSDIKKATVRPNGGPRKIFDGHGLHIYITATSKRWKYDYRFQGKAQTISYGPYPSISLAMARQLHRNDYDILQSGLNPASVKKQLKAEAETVRTFKQMAEEFQTRHKASAGTLAKSASRLSKYVYPFIGDTYIDQITTSMLVPIIRAAEKKHEGDTARRVLMAMRQVFKDAVASGMIQQNPADQLDGTLRKPEKTNYSHLTDTKQIGQLLNAIHQVEASPAIKALAELLPLLFCRPSELRLAKWSEVNFDTKQLTIPAERLKLRQHGDLIIPLSRQAILILRALIPYTEATGLVFASELRSRKTRQYISLSEQFPNKTIGQAIALAELPSKCQSAHGWRHVATTLLNECGPKHLKQFSPAWVDAQTHHKPAGNNTIYNKAQYIAERTRMMQVYADLLDSLRGVEPALKVVS